MSGGAGTPPDGSGEATGQLALVPAPAPTPPGTRSRRRKTESERPAAEVDPVAAVLVDTGLAHLDRPFEYLVPADLDVDARPGCRVRVRFAGRDHDGFLLERRAEPDHPGRLAPLRSVVSPEGVLTPAVLAAATSVAEHYGGTLPDVLRLAIPPRHARAERGVPPRAGDPSTDPQVPPSTGTPSPAATGPEAAPTDRSLVAVPWDPYPAGPAFLRRTEAGESPAAAWTALPARGPGTDWPAAVGAAVGAALRGGRGAVVVVPDHRDVDRVVDAVTAEAGEGVCARLTADLGPEARYRAFLSLLRGHARVAVGTRSAAWAPVVRPGLFVCWDDGDDLHQEPRAPYPHVRKVLLERARHEEAALLVGGYARSVELEAWAAAGVVARIEPPRAVVRSCAPRVTVAGEGRAEERDPAARTARIPSTAWRALRDGLTLGPVLVQVPRQGYVVSLTCAEPGCRTPARCPRCEGPVGLPGAAAAATCRWCGDGLPRGAGCRSCGSPRLRAAGVGAGRTAEELGRAFPGARVVRSGGEHVVARVPDAPALVVATPGAEPVAEEGYRAVVLLDGWRLLDRAALDASVEAHRRWLSAAALVRSPGGDGPRPGVVLCGVPAHAGVPAVEALVRWDPVSLAARELAERTTLGLPPVRRHVTVSGPGSGVRDVVEALGAAGQVVLGAASPAGPDGRRAAVVREGAAGTLAPAVRAVRATRSARKTEDSVRLVLDVAEAAS
ncbi:primosome assembly protein PriA [Ornithinimicrobium cerasi]|uniref:primosomal protein N' family DNA-binding protein n=1 Tax=Ornithinimicrobium cerasi TaxID=2248773 RepID=UPI001379CED9|nr:primosome assembly protein PriA [Ornithinimicrobium cerasi]